MTWLDFSCQRSRSQQALVRRPRRCWGTEVYLLVLFAQVWCSPEADLVIINADLSLMNCMELQWRSWFTPQIKSLSSGKEFQTVGPCTANARRPTVESRYHGTTISWCVANPRCCLLATLVTGVQQSTRFRGALPCSHLCIMTRSLYLTRSATSSQCRSSCKIWVRPWSNFLVSLTTRAAAFITRCRVSVSDLAALASTALHWTTLEITNPWTIVAVDSESSERRTRLSNQ